MREVESGGVRLTLYECKWYWCCCACCSSSSDSIPSSRSSDSAIAISSMLLLVSREEYITVPYKNKLYTRKCMHKHYTGIYTTVWEKQRKENEMKWRQTAEQKETKENSEYMKCHIMCALCRACYDMLYIVCYQQCQYGSCNLKMCYWCFYRPIKMNISIINF